MACGCNKNRNFKNNDRTVAPVGSITSASQLRQQAVPPQHPQPNPATANTEKRKSQALRRDAIRRALNK
jgi:hypothetical protein